MFIRKPYKFLLLSPDFPPPFVGGSLVYIHNLISNSGLPCAVFTGESEDARARESVVPEGVDIFTSRWLVPSTKPSRLNLILMYAFLSLWYCLIGRKYLLLLNFGPVGNSIPLLVARLLSGFRVSVKPIVVQAYAEEITLAVQAKGVKGLLKRYAVRRYNDASGIISVSHFALAVLREECGVNVSNNIVLPTPMHSLKVGASSDVAKSRKIRILSVGRLIKRKGFDLLIKCFLGLKDRYPDNIELVIAGDGPESEYLHSLAKYNEDVKLLGSVDEKTLVELYASAHIFVLCNRMLPNGDCEGCPNVLVEAASFGLPLIAGNIGGADEIVKPKFNGFLIDTEDSECLDESVSCLINNVELRKNFGLNSIEIARKNHDPAILGRAFARYMQTFE